MFSTIIILLGLNVFLTVFDLIVGLVILSYNEFTKLISPTKTIYVHPNLINGLVKIIFSHTDHRNLSPMISFIEASNISTLSVNSFNHHVNI